MPRVYSGNAYLDYGFYIACLLAVQGKIEVVFYKAMMIFGHKIRSVFGRYNIVSDTDLIIAAQKQEVYLKTQVGTNSGTVVEIPIKKAFSENR